MERLFTVSIFETSKLLQDKKVQQHTKCNFRKSKQLKIHFEQQGFKAVVTTETIVE